MTTKNILGITGSLRGKSLNAALMRAVVAGIGDRAQVQLADIGTLPLYNGDLDVETKPPSVRRLLDQLRAADALIIVTPEYNYSIPGVLKNAIDWASRPPEQPFDGKPIAIMGASGGGFGTARAQYHLRQCFVFLNAPIMLRPEVMIAAAQNKFDAESRLTDQPTRDAIAASLAALATWARRFPRA